MRVGTLRPRGKERLESMVVLSSRRC